MESPPVPHVDIVGAGREPLADARVNHQLVREARELGLLISPMTSASGGPASPKVGSSPSSVSASSRPKATVLPDPVRDETSRSRPARAGAITSRCTGVGSS